ncbi:hypothetical protein PUV54_13500 [Hyphococcus flavus]|uniref:RHS repeat protein n=1 Tax=Hyphococcus flavus TaxID=1866326 RepID=A0AAF0CBH3_9PROT|nr:hypothetical protein [Hyphococcus flavus]WDI30970.1 hypothetical protein PUV54_13500 [Hyphococcus flavus]
MQNTAWTTVFRVLAFRTRASFIALFSCLVAFVAPAAAAADTRLLPVREDAVFVDYFATLPFRETPFAPLSGIHRLTEADAAQRNHFRFEYDRKGRPIRVAFMLGDLVREVNDAANYYFYTPVVEISYGPSTETRIFFDKHGNRINANGDVFREQYTLDKNGYRKELTFYDHKDEPSANSWGVVRYEWSILDDGEVIEKRFDTEGNLAPLRASLPFYETRLHYGYAGWLSVMRNYGLEGKLVLNELNAAQDMLEFNANGDIMSWNVLDVNGDLIDGNSPRIARGIMEKNEFGYDISERYENAAGERVMNAYGRTYNKTTYDEFGNYLERGNYTLDGSSLLINEQRGYAGFRYEYDPSGHNRISLELFDENKKGVANATSGFARVEYDYDQQGNMIEIRFLTTDGVLMDRNDTGLAIIQHEYDSRGRRIETRYLNAKGVLTNDARTSIAVTRREYGDHGVPTRVTNYNADMELVE